MQAKPIIAIIDVGKTNKKLFLFDEQYQIVFEQCEQFPETVDEDGFSCEDVQLLTEWMHKTLDTLSRLTEFEVRAINFSAYGASFVHIDENNKPVTPLYNYLKPFPEPLNNRFYGHYGEKPDFALATASPVLGNLNSGLQLYRLKQEKPALFQQIKWSLHLPQFLSFLITKQAYSDITSIGCHTALWDFTSNRYHDWVYQEGIDKKLPPVRKGNEVVRLKLGENSIPVGVGLHDSSAALIPYLASFTEPFVLISTGTWCISLNPFTASPLTADELQQDCLCYLTYEGKPVKASRLFAGNEHEQQTKRLADHFNVAHDYYKIVAYNPELVQTVHDADIGQTKADRIYKDGAQPSEFGSRYLNSFSTYEEAYHQLIVDIMAQQLASTSLVLKNSSVEKIFVDGGFSKNPIYMSLLAAAFPDKEVYAASVSQATSLGAALAIHKEWNNKPLSTNLIELKRFSVSTMVTNEKAAVK
jgi:sugar (pentulose or hexulose) kinase